MQPDLFKPLTSPNARLVNATLAREDSASLRWIKTVDLLKQLRLRCRALQRGHRRFLFSAFCSTAVFM